MQTNENQAAMEVGLAANTLQRLCNISTRILTHTASHRYLTEHQIKLIAIELKAKNTELTELLRTSREKEKAAVSDYERLREQLRNSQSDENRVVPYQENAIQLSNDGSNAAELQHYKTIVDQLMSDRAVFTQRLGELMNINSYVGSAKEINALIEDLRVGNDAVASNPTSRALVVTQPSDEVGEQIRNLTLENSELAQRLGGAVAEKEFALSSKLMLF